MSDSFLLHLSFSIAQRLSPVLNCLVTGIVSVLTDTLTAIRLHHQLSFRRPTPATLLWGSCLWLSDSALSATHWGLSPNYLSGLPHPTKKNLTPSEEPGFDINTESC